MWQALASHLGSDRTHSRRCNVSESSARLHATGLDRRCADTESIDPLSGHNSNWWLTEVAASALLRVNRKGWGPILPIQNHGVTDFWAVNFRSAVYPSLRLWSGTTWWRRRGLFAAATDRSPQSAHLRTGFTKPVLIDLVADRQRLPSARGRSNVGPKRVVSGLSGSRRTELLMMARTRTDGCNTFNIIRTAAAIGEPGKGQNGSKRTCLMRGFANMVGFHADEPQTLIRRVRRGRHKRRTGKTRDHGPRIALNVWSYMHTVSRHDKPQWYVYSYKTETQATQQYNIYRVVQKSENPVLILR